MHTGAIPSVRCNSSRDRKVRCATAAFIIVPKDMTTANGFDPESLYAVFLHRGNWSSWHVGLYLPEPLRQGDTPLSESSITLIDNRQTTFKGLVFHCTNMNSSEEWIYEIVDAGPSGIDVARRLVLGVKLADLASFGPRGDVMAEIERITREEVEIHPEAHRSVFNCRIWTLSAISALHDFGFLHCSNVIALEREMVNAALLATPTYEKDGSHKIIVSKHCS